MTAVTTRMVRSGGYLVEDSVTGELIVEDTHRPATYGHVIRDGLRVRWEITEGKHGRRLAAGGRGHRRRPQAHHRGCAVTLSTNVYVIDEVDVGELFRFAQGLLTKYDDRPEPQSPNHQVWSDEERSDIWNEPGTRVIRNQLGQGLPAILDIDYRPGAPLRTAEQAAKHDEDCDADCTGKYHSRACWAGLDLDTAYGYKDARGWGCGDLHAVLVAEIGKWLDERGVRWEWRNEFTGDVHGGEDRYERLIDLVSGGFEASAWFRTSVLPAIAAGMLDGPEAAS